MIPPVINSVIFILLGYFLSYFFLKLSIPYFSKFLADQPNKRSSHYFKKPTSGGVIFVLISPSMFFLSNNLIPLFCIPLALVGLFDDKYNLSSKFRYFAQFITSLIITQYTTYTLISNKTNFLLSLVISLFIAFCITAIINFINFMDGIDGLVSGCLIISFIFMALTFDFNIFLIVGSILGFLYWNWYPSKIFMGDVGSTFIAAMYCGFTLQNNSLEYSISNLLILFPLFLDAIVCIILRKMDNQNVFKPHNLHLYQRLHQGGMSHQTVSLIYIFSSLIIAVICLCKYYQFLFFILPLEIIIAIYLNKYFATPFLRKKKNLF